MPITVTKLGQDGHEYDYVFAADADGAVTVTRRAFGGKGNILQQTFSADEVAEIRRSVTDEAASKAHLVEPKG